ncbi:MAG: gfo 1, partial [Armatimonadetes bacterium]|nr:gfo 1 [Armatimonadota bacterium]
AQSFIDECQAQVPHLRVPEALGSYEELLGREDIDAVYIPLPTGLRKEWVIRAAEAGKHVLVEKPVGVSAADVEEILAACERHRVQFMDGVMFMHGRRLSHLRAVVDQQIAPVRHVASQFSFLAGEEFQQTNIRTHGTLEPLGCLGDLGWYCLRFTLWAMGEAEPLRATGRIHAEAQAAGAPPVPLAFSGTLEFAGGASASYFCSFNAAHSQWAVVSGEQGLLQLSDFVLPFAGDRTRYTVTRSAFDVDGCRVDFRPNQQTEELEEPSNNAPGSQEAGLFKDFSQLVLDGRLDPSWGRISLLTQRALDACLQSAHKYGAPVDLA